MTQPPFLQDSWNFDPYSSVYTETETVFGVFFFFFCLFTPSNRWYNWSTGVRDPCHTVVSGQHMVSEYLLRSQVGRVTSSFLAEAFKNTRQSNVERKKLPVNLNGGLNGKVIYANMEVPTQKHLVQRIFNVDPGQFLLVLCILLLGYMTTIFLQFSPQL